MKRRLFWKILIGFWATFFVMVHGIWLLFMVLRSEPSEMALSLARMSVASASLAIHSGGEKAYFREIGRWPRPQQRQIEIHTGAAASSRPDPVLADASARSPSGKTYRVTYYRQHSPPFAPREVVIVGGVGGLIFSAILAWYLTQPVERMRRGFRRLAQGDFTTRLGPAMGRRRDEIADLAHDFDQMAVQLQELLAARDRLLADVSHELRTPLARLNLAIALARQDPGKIAASLDRIGKEAGELDEMVGELLTLSKLESGKGQSIDYFDFAEIVQGVVQDAGYEAAAKEVAITLNIRAGAKLDWIAQGSGRLVSRAVENIVRNAVRYSPRAGRVEIDLHRDTGFYRLAITDNGPGIPPDQLGQPFTPFAPSADGFGFGLGLAIAQRAIAVHGGSIAARNREHGGLEMTITVPVVQIDEAQAKA